MLEGGYLPGGGAYLPYGFVTYTYNRRFWPTQIKVTTDSGSPPTLFDLSYSYLGNGDVSTITNNRDNTRTETVTYDNLNRTATAQSQATSGANCWGQSYAYDPYGNLTGITTTQCSAPTLSLSVNTKNRITNPGVTYDNAGNVVGEGLYTYVWDAENRLTSANGVTYTYDGDGRRVKKSNGTLYWYDTKGNVLEETDLSGNFQYDYAYFNGQRIGRRDSAGNMLSYFNDVLSTARVIAGPNSTLAESDYYPFGGERVISDTLTPDNHYKFTGMERDTETGLDHTLFRQYTSSLGRWMSPDPLAGDVLNPQSLNRYAYVGNNPCSETDPTGLLFPTPDPIFDVSNGGIGYGYGPYGGGGSGGGGGGGYPSWTACHDVYGGDGEGGEKYLGTVCSTSYLPILISSEGGGGGGRPPCSSLSLNNPAEFRERNFATPGQVEAFLAAQPKAPASWSGGLAATDFSNAGLNPGLAVGILGAETSFGGGPPLSESNIANPFGVTGATNFASSASGAAKTVRKLESHADNPNDPLAALIGDNTLKQVYTNTQQKAWVSNVNSWFRKFAKFLGRCE